jgi:ATP-dependent DNA helicase RecG
MNTLKKLIHLGEGYRLELKESLDKSFVEEVCAFANSGGGKIILGVSDKGMIKGINTDNSFRSRVQDTIKLEPKLDVTIAVVGNLIVVDVPEGAEKPYACSKGFFVRIGPNTQKLSRNEIVSLFQKEGRIRFDEIENRKADLERDFDETAFQKFLQFASITPSIDRTFLLRNLDCINENNKLTNAGVLFFCKSTEFLLFHATVVCVLYKGNQKLHILDKKDFMGNIVDNINNAMTFVNRHTNLIYKIDSLRRTEIPEIPEVALRESIVNAVCHRDYFQKGANVMIEIFDDCVSITNPGGLPADLKPSEFGSKSVVRNAVIASLLHRIDYIEKIGTGINRIKNAVREHGQCNVSFSFDTFFTVTFRRNIKNKHLIGDNTITKVGDNSNKVGDSSNKVGDNSIKVGDSSNKVGDNSIKVGDNLLEKVGDRLTKNQYAILACIRDNNRVSARQLSKKVGISQRKIEENIVKLRNKKIIKRIGSPRGGHWEVFLS